MRFLPPRIHRDLPQYNRAQQAGALSSYELEAEQLVWRLGAVERIRLLRSDR